MTGAETTAPAAGGRLCPVAGQKVGERCLKALIQAHVVVYSFHDIGIRNHNTYPEVDAPVPLPADSLCP
jgi:hypothetical protein